MAILTYAINDWGVIDNGRPGNSPGYWAHDILEHTVEPHPHSYIDEYLAAGAAIACEDYTYPAGVVKLMYKIARIKGELDNLCPGAYGPVSDPQGIANLIRDALACEGMTGPMPCDNIVTWMYRGADLYRERFPDNYRALREVLAPQIDDAWLAWIGRRKFRELVVDTDRMLVNF